MLLKALKAIHTQLIILTSCIKKYLGRIFVMWNFATTMLVYFLVISNTIQGSAPGIRKIETVEGKSRVFVFLGKFIRQGFLFLPPGIAILS